MRSLISLTPILSGEKFSSTTTPRFELPGASLTREIQYHGLRIILSQGNIYAFCTDYAFEYSACYN